MFPLMVRNALPFQALPSMKTPLKVLISNLYPLAIENIRMNLLKFTLKRVI